MSKFLLEVCVDSLDSAMVAEEGGADRIELNVALGLGGLTPPSSLVRAVLELVTTPVVVMVRPRTGNFSYSDMEKSLMLADAEQFCDLGVAGVVAGALDDSGGLDISFWAKLRAVTLGKEVVFHRAIDCASNPDAIVDDLCQMKTDRILTSGGARSALAGAEQLQKWQEQYGSQIEILAGAGVTPQNIAELVRRTGCRQVHGSFSEPMVESLPLEGFGSRLQTSLAKLRAVRKALAGERT